MPPTTQRREHPPGRRRKSMLLAGRINIKEVYSSERRLLDDGPISVERTWKSFVGDRAMAADNTGRTESGTRSFVVSGRINRTCFRLTTPRRPEEVAPRAPAESH